MPEPFTDADRRAGRRSALAARLPGWRTLRQPLLGIGLEGVGHALPYRVDPIAHDKVKTRLIAEFQHLYALVAGCIAVERVLGAERTIASTQASGAELQLAGIDAV